MCRCGGTVAASSASPPAAALSTIRFAHFGEVSRVASSMGQLESRERFPALDGIRALAIGFVLLTHFTPGRDSNDGLRSLVFKLADIGWAGVDLFFALSGFLITRILLGLSPTRANLLQFLGKRILRLAPVYYLGLLLVFFVTPIATGLYAVPALSFQLPLWLYASNYFPAGYQFVAGHAAVGHFWSLALEVQFYLIWPLVVFSVASKRTLTWICAALLLTVLLTRLILTSVGAEWHVTYAYLPTRLDGLVAGAWVAVLFQSVDRPSALARRVVAVLLAFGVSLILYAAWKGMGGYIFSEARHSDVLVFRAFAPTCLAMAFGAAIWFAIYGHPLTKWLQFRPFAYVARWSYSIYVLHYLFYPSVVKAIGPARIAEIFQLGPNMSVFVFFVFASILSVIAGAVVYHCVERPVLQSRWYLGQR